MSRKARRTPAEGCLALEATPTPSEAPKSSSEAPSGPEGHRCPKCSWNYEKARRGYDKLWAGAEADAIAEHIMQLEGWALNNVMMAAMERAAELGRRQDGDERSDQGGQRIGESIDPRAAESLAEIT